MSAMCTGLTKIRVLHCPRSSGVTEDLALAAVRQNGKALRHVRGALLGVPWSCIWCQFPSMSASWKAAIAELSSQS